MSIPESEFPERFAVARCALLDDCCVEAGFTSSRSDCVAGVKAETEAQIDEALSVGAKYDPAAGTACVGVFNTRCAALESFKTRNDAGGPCDRVYSGGRVPLGGICGFPASVSAWVCAGNETGRVTCDGALVNGAVLRICQRIPAEPAVASCDAAGARSGECGARLVCHDGRCVSPRLGDPCNGALGDPCAPGTVCDRLNTHTCILPPKAPGEACASMEECELYRCDSGRCVSPGSLAAASVCTP